MENLLVLYIASFIFFYLLGRATVLCLEILFQKTYNYIFDLKIESFFIFIGIFISSQFLFVINFIYGLNKINLGLCFLIVFFLNFLKIKKIKDFKYLLLNFSIASILFISFYDISLSKDSFLYHLSTQSWIYSEKIVFGISNIYDIESRLDTYFRGYGYISHQEGVVINYIILIMVKQMVQ